MDAERKAALLEKLAAAAAPKLPMPAWDEIGRAFGKSTAAGVGKQLTDIIGEKIQAKWAPKPKLMQQLLGKGGFGRKALAIGGLAAAVGAGASGAEKGVNALSGHFSKKRGYAAMMADNPNLKREPPKDVKRIYNTLHRFSPKMATDPLVAGSFLKKTLMFKEEGIHPNDIKTLTEVGKNITQGKPKKDSRMADIFKATAGQAFE